MLKQMSFSSFWGSRLEDKVDNNKAILAKTSLCRTILPKRVELFA